jgi:hypothetical protein
VSYAVAASALAASVVTGIIAKPAKYEPSLAHKFVDRWEDVPPRIVPLPPKPVKTIVIAPDIEEVLEAPMPLPKKVAPPPAPPKVVATAPAPPKAKPKEVDICRGRGKVYTRGGKSWRCKRS